ncbi:MAG: conjugal transfer protein TraX [Lachnospiraceae bacterium]|nr:conjugal transfer protein TraX [Lachnospiraceae bacterium]
MNRIKFLSAYQIKLIMILLMLLDHLSFIQGFIPSDISYIFTLISRCVAPMFAYLVVEGVIYTHNLKNYYLRLFYCAILMFLGNIITFKFFIEPIQENKDMFSYLLNNNIFITLSLGVLTIMLIMRARIATPKYYILAFICFFIGFLWSEWGTVLLPFILVTYLFREKKSFLVVGYLLIALIAFMIPFSEPWWFTVFPFIFLYNGKRGLNSIFAKYFFYIFYPLHIWIIVIINYIISL